MDAEPIGGGESAVYRAVHEDGRAVAVKVAHAPLPEGAWLEEERACLTALAGHPELAEGIVPLLDHGTWSGRPFLVTPWMPETLAQWVAREPDLGRRVAMAARLADVVAALHAVRPARVHRDLKPANVLVDEAGLPRLADFGCARALVPGRSTTVHALHTPGYAPPELSRAIPHRPHAHQDRYALGAVVCFVLTGAPPNTPGVHRDNPEGGLCAADRRALARLELAPTVVDALDGLMQASVEERAPSLDALHVALAHWRGQTRSRRRAAAAALALLPVIGLGHAPAEPAYAAVRLPAGAHTVTEQGEERVIVLDQPLWVGRSEVTQGLWREVMGEDAAHTRRRFEGRSVSATCASYEGVSLVGDALPVVCVDLYDAVRFANALSERDGLQPAYALAEQPGRAAPEVRQRPEADGWRLPSSAEWEAAARGGPDWRPPSEAEACGLGNTGDARAVAAFGPVQAATACDDGFAALAPVCAFAPNALGVCDALGNVAEWVWVEGGGYARGGSWSSGPSLGAITLGASLPAEVRTPTLGFRLVRLGP